ncbi:hypothetical protein B0H14DRAFT_2560182 [Mycena olivaceomarginata]|nr:hypothetical protein B0H14DRAFT_2560182 [Mycena olivaceomarginata]
MTKNTPSKFTAKDKDKGKHKAGSASEGSDLETARKKPRNKATQDSAPPPQGSTPAGSASAGGQGTSGTVLGASDPAMEEDKVEGMLNKETAQKRLCVPWGIQPKEVPKGSKLTQCEFQRFIRALCSLVKQSNILPSAKDKLTHYGKRFDEVDNFCHHIRALVATSRTAIWEATLCFHNVNNVYANDYEMLCDMYDNYVYGTLAQNTKMERQCPGSLSQSQKNSTASKARARVAKVRFNTAYRLNMQKPIQCMAFVDEVHSDNKQDGNGAVHTGIPEVKCERQPEVQVLAQNVSLNEPNLRKPAVRQHNPLQPASDIRLVLPPDVPIDFFTPDV